MNWAASPPNSRINTLFFCSLAALILLLAACSAPATEAPEAEAGDIAITWSREGGIAGFCDELVVYVDGTVNAASCKGEPRSGRLDAGQLEQLQAWIEELKPFENDQTDPASADAMTIRLVFTGSGAKEPSEAEKHAILDFAAQVYSSINN